ncbi:MAG TPA: GAF domain-containing protein [Candidatus Koribacter sp.]
MAASCEKEGLTPLNGEKLARAIAQQFTVHEDEVAILRIEETRLIFVYPVKLHDVGYIPLNATTSVAGRTAATKHPEVINNFPQTKHVSVFESVELSTQPHSLMDRHDKPHIQKLMSAPVMKNEKAVGAVQVCRKGMTGPSSGADFRPEDLQKLVSCCSDIAGCF